MISLRSLLYLFTIQSIICIFEELIFVVNYLLFFTIIKGNYIWVDIILFIYFFLLLSDKNRS